MCLCCEPAVPGFFNANTLDILFKLRLAGTSVFVNGVTISRHCAGKNGPLNPEAALLYTELYAGKGENGYVK
jgi:hypothetical protein